MPPQSLLRRIPAFLACLGVSVACALWMLYPAWLDGEHVLVGDWRHPDMLSNHWLYNWVGERISPWSLPFHWLSGSWADPILHNDRYYFPVGDAPWLAGNGGDAVPYALMHGLGWPGSVTAWLLLTLVLNGVATWALCRRMGAGWPGTVFGVAVMGISSYLAHELSGGRFSQVPLYGLVGFTWAWIGLLERPTVGRGALAGLLLGWTGALYWYYGLWAAWMGGILGLAWLVAHRHEWRKGLPPRHTIPGLVFVGTAVAILAPLLRVFLAHWTDIPGSDDLAFPNPLALTSSLPFTFPFHGGSLERAEVILPVSALVLAGLGLRQGRDWRTWGLVSVGALFYLLALGPDLVLPDGTSTGIPGPYRVVYGGLGMLRRYWWPYRHVVVLSIPVAVLAARGLDALCARLPRGQALALPFLLILVLPMDLALRGGRASPAMTWWEEPEAYQALAAMEGDVVLELPLAPRVTSCQQSLTYQRVHGKALINGHAMWVDRVRPKAWDAWVGANSFLTAVQQYEQGQLFGPFAFRPEDVLTLREMGLRYIVVNAEYFPKALYGLVDRYKVLLPAFFGEPAYTWRDQFYVWDLDRYNFGGFAEAPAFSLPSEYLDRDGSQMLDLGHNRALGLRGLTRVFPPRLPPGGEPGSPEEMGNPAMGGGTATPNGPAEAFPVRPIPGLPPADGSNTVPQGALPPLPAGQPALPPLPAGQPTLPPLPAGQPMLPPLPAGQPMLPPLPPGQPALQPLAPDRGR